MASYPAHVGFMPAPLKSAYMMPKASEMGLAEFLRYMVEAGGSDLHLKAGEPPVIRVDGLLHRTSYAPLPPTDTETIALELLSDVKAQEFQAGHEAETAFQLKDLGRFRVSVYRQRGQVSLAIRRVRSNVFDFDALHLPPGAQALARERRGLVLVTGPAGTGKTTTIAAMIGWMNEHRPAHIITIEDPIEVIHEDMLSIVEQREVGTDTASYSDALRAAVRQDPDVIFIGEIRDRETAEGAIQAAETGHLVISTLHTLDATETVNRIIDLFPSEMHGQARISLAATLRGVLSQRLVPRADGSGRVPAVEVLVNTGRVSERIADPEQTHSIPELIAEGEYYGMQSFDQALVRLVKEELITIDAALDVASNPHDLKLALQMAQLV